VSEKGRRVETGVARSRAGRGDDGTGTHLQLRMPVPMARKKPKTRPPPAVFLSASPIFCIDDDDDDDDDDVGGWEGDQKSERNGESGSQTWAVDRRRGSGWSDARAGRGGRPGGRPDRTYLGRRDALVSESLVRAEEESCGGADAGAHERAVLHLPDALAAVRRHGVGAVGCGVGRGVATRDASRDESIGLRRLGEGVYSRGWKLTTGSTTFLYVDRACRACMRLRVREGCGESGRQHRRDLLHEMASAELLVRTGRRVGIGIICGCGGACTCPGGVLQHSTKSP
jgi:hypothetical protein